MISGVPELNMPQFRQKPLREPASGRLALPVALYYTGVF